MDVVIAHRVDPYGAGLGGGVQYLLNLLRLLLERGHQATLLGVQIAEKTTNDLGFTFVPVLRGSRDWLLYVLALSWRLMFLKFPRSTIVHTNRLDFMFLFATVIRLIITDILFKILFD